MKPGSGKWEDCALFRDISGEDLSAMMACLKPTSRTYEKDARIAVSGEPFSGLGIVMSGRAAVAKESADGNRTILTLIEPGMMFGEMVAFSDTSVWPASVLAQSECRAMFISPEKIVGQCANQCPHHRQLVRNMLGIVSNRALMLNRKVEYLSFRSVRKKVSAFLVDQYRCLGKSTFVLPLNRNEMADFLNVARPALSREMGRMRDDGIVDFHRSTVKIIDLEALMREI